MAWSIHVHAGCPCSQSHVVIWYGKNTVHVAGMYFNCPLAASAVKPSAPQIVQEGFVTVFAQAFFLFLVPAFCSKDKVSVAICVANGALSYLHVLIAITFSWCGCPCGRCRTARAVVVQRGSRARHDLFTVPCCTMCFTYTTSWFLPLLWCWGFNWSFSGAHWVGFLAAGETLWVMCLVLFIWLCLCRLHLQRLHPSVFFPFPSTWQVNLCPDHMSPSLPLLVPVAFSSSIIWYL